MARGRVKKSTVKRRVKKTEKENSSKEKNFDWTLEKIANFIKERAYYIWEGEGKPQGRDLDIWLKAEKEVLSQLIK